MVFYEKDLSSVRIKDEEQVILTSGNAKVRTSTETP